jgi:hypothetical protein
MRENICQYSSDKGLMSSIYKELKNLNTKRKTQSIKGQMNRKFPKEEKMTKKFMKKCSTFFAIK